MEGGLISCKCGQEEEGVQNFRGKASQKRRPQWLRRLQAVSHIACRSHAAPMPFPCHAVPLRVQNVSFPFDLHSTAVSDSHLPCHDHAILRPCRSSQEHGTEGPSTDGLWATLPAFGFFPLPHGVPRRLLSEAHQSQTQVVSVKPNTVCHGRGKERQQHTTNKTICYTVGLAVRIFRLSCGHSRRTRHCRSRAGARHGKCELKHGMACERHGQDMLCVNRP